jgi:putative IMPACT (imprinted ancient) family translation regulator
VSELTRDTFPVLQGKGEGIYKAKGSKFVAYAGPLVFGKKTESEARAKEFLEAVRKAHHSARHVVYAWQLGEGEHRFTDDGEPAGSSGAPTHGALRSRDLHYSIVAVVRYFGGVKLGVGGLIEAYRAAAGEACDNAGSAPRTLEVGVTVSFNPALTGHVMMVGKNGGARIVAERYERECVLDWTVAAGSRVGLEAAFEGVHGVTVVRPKT